MNEMPRRLLIPFLCAGVFAAFPAKAQHAVQFGAALVPPFGDSEGHAVIVEYEYGLGERLAVFARGMRIGYFYDDEVYEEDGTATGVGGGLRFFPGGGGKGFYLGASLAAFDADYDWIDDKGTRYRSRGTGSSRGMQWGGELGYRFDLSKTVALTPAINVGSWMSASHQCRTSSGQTCGSDGEFSFYAVGSLLVGVRF